MSRNKISRVHVNPERLTKALKLWGGNVYDLSEELGRERSTLKDIANGRESYRNPPAAFIKMVCDRIHADYDWIVEPETPSPTPLEALAAETEETNVDRSEEILAELVKLNEKLTDAVGWLELIYTQG